MKFRVRYFNWGSPSKGMHRHPYEWTLSAANDASGRELIKIAMRAAGWPEGPYKAVVEQQTGAIQVSVTVEERPSQLIAIWIEEQRDRFEPQGFEYFESIGSRIAYAAWSRVVALGIYMVCLAGLITIAIGQLVWVFAEPERTRGIAVKVDQGANGALRGNPQETISSRANRARIGRRRWGCVLCWVLDRFKQGHCEDSAGK